MITSYRPLAAFSAACTLLLSLAAPVRAQSTIYFTGLEHRALGQAVLGIAGGNLLVGNIGTSGQDGVLVEATEAESVRLEMQLDPSLVPPGANHALEAHGIRDGVPATSLQVLSLLRTQSGFALLPSFAALGSSRYTASVYDAAGNLLYQEADLSAGEIELQPALAMTLILSATTEGTIDLYDFEDEPVSTPAGVLVASRVVLESDTPAFTSLVLTQMRVRASGVSGFRIFSERLGLFGDRAHGALGDARMSSDLAQSVLTLNNLGASGDDGVAVELEGDERDRYFQICSWSWGPQAPVGAGLRVESHGTVDAVPDSPYASLAVIKQGTGVFSLEADYQAVSPSSRYIRWKLNDVYVSSYQISGASGEVARASENPPSFTMGRSTTAAWASPVQVTPPSGAPFTADELIVTPVDPIACYELLGRVLIFGSNMPEVRIEGEALVSPPEIGNTYCSPAIPHSGGLPARIAAFGSAELAQADVYLRASDLPVNQFGYFLASRTPGAFIPPGSSGVLCLAGTIGRYAGQIGSSGAAGVRALTVDLNAIPTFPVQAVQVGQTWHFQLWFRDFGPTSNFTDAVRITFH